MSQTTGTAKITVNGIFIDTFKGVTFNPGGFKRNPVTTSHKTHFSKEPVPSHLEFEKAVVKGDSIMTLDVENATIQIEFDTGQSYVMPNAFRLDPADISDEGKSKYTFEGDAAKEIS